MAKRWIVVAPNGHHITINTGGYSDSHFKHGQETNNEIAASRFPQYFIPIPELAAPAPAAAPEKTPEPSLEEKMLNESDETSKDGPQMLTEVPKPLEVDSEDSKPEVLEEKPKKGRSKKRS